MIPLYYTRAISERFRARYYKGFSTDFGDIDYKALYKLPSLLYFTFNSIIGRKLSVFVPICLLSRVAQIITVVTSGHMTKMAVAPFDPL